MAYKTDNSDLKPLLSTLEIAFEKEDTKTFQTTIDVFEESIYEGDWIPHTTNDPPGGPYDRVEYIAEDNFSYTNTIRYIHWIRTEGDECSVAKYRRVKREYRSYDGGIISIAIERIRTAFEYEDRIVFDDMIYFLRYILEFISDPPWVESEGLKPYFKHPRQLVEIKLRDGYVFRQFVGSQVVPESEDGLVWDIRGKSSDIVFYRPLPTL